MILFQVRDLAAKACGEPHVAPSWDIAKASLGAMLAKTPELAERAKTIKIEYIGEFDPETGFDPVALPTWEQKVSTGDVCLAEFREAVAAEESVADAGYDYTPGMKGEAQAEADRGDPGIRAIQETDFFKEESLHGE